MLNYIWLGLVVAAVIIGGCTDNLKAVADSSFEMAEFAVMKTALPLVGIMALWLGVMRLAERAGLVALLARALRPLMRWLFPEVPHDHPAMGSMLLNMAASILGLGNAATPLGLRAMKDLDTLNPHPGTATNAMCTYLAINTSSIQLIPATAIAVLAANHSNNPTAIVGTSIMATTCAAIAAVASAKSLQRLPFFREPPVASPAARPPSSSGDKASPPTPNAENSPLHEAPTLKPLSWWGQLLLGAYGLFFLYLFARLAFPAVLSSLHLQGFLEPRTLPEAMKQGLFVRIVDAISKLSIPFLLSAFPLYAILRRVKVYEEFVEGAKEGFDVGIRIIPYLVAILVAIGMFRAAGGIALLSNLLRPLMLAVGFPPDLLPLVLMRPLSGSGTLGTFAELVKQCGPDSLVTRMGGTIYGSTETTFYVLAVYFGSVAVKRTRYAVLAGLTADFVGVVASVIVCRLVFG
ncbi:MAG TPA: nucleoside recognition domain-containing protein [Candidatus Acidoferrum sp.]|jgi:spore maturation protein SpmA|nr:nucleoside recognition domain-containing protein [Candidatus Acidoferrum sp.]